MISGLANNNYVLGPTYMYIQPVLSYSSETRALTQALQDNVDAFDNICLRRIFRIWQAELTFLFIFPDTVSRIIILDIWKDE